VLPAGSNEISYEGELAVVIKTITKGVKAENAAECIYGYTIANDVTARDWQRTDGQWARAKGFDTSCPLGPWIETELDPSDLGIVTTLDGEVKQDGTTADMIHGIGAIIEHASAAFTLLPGDVILTGTPAGVGLVEAGQQVTVEIAGIGALTNTFVRR
jgi:2-keto-4-pentenoate hydratase/2-oxohepta-3-ene-1,7-dioic acid hydratase in catechol pathway